MTQVIVAERTNQPSGNSRVEKSTEEDQCSTALPDWKHLLRPDDERWVWRGQKLVHCDQFEVDIPHTSSSALQRLIVNKVYAAQKKSPQISRCLSRLFTELDAGNWGLNLGSGTTRHHPQLINLDIQDSANVDVLNLGTELPFKNDSLDLVISQEVLEHIDDPWHTISEVYRVLRPGGKFYCQVPFVIGFHPGPCDYWRFSRQALEHLFNNQHWEMETLELSLGHGSGFYRILVEFLAVTASTISQRLYRPAKGLAALACYPFQWFDYLTPFSAEKDRIPGGYLCVAVKR